MEPGSAHLTLDEGRRMALVLSALLDHAVSRSHGGATTALSRHSDLVQLTVVVTGCSPACLTGSDQAPQLLRSEIGPGDVRWTVRDADGAVRLDWLLATVPAAPAGTAYDGPRRWEAAS